MKNLGGAITALVTPFKEQKVDLKSYANIIRYQVERGIQGFVVNGTTGESPTLTTSECESLFYTAKEQGGSNLPIIMGVGTNSTVSTVENAKQAERWGADALLVVVPYYNKPPQRGMFEHFCKVADAVQIPIILYNVPGRTVATLELETIQKLANHPNITAIKEATGNLDFAKQIYESCGSKLQLLSGDDESYEGFLKVGGQGIISVASHVLVKPFVTGKIQEHMSFIKSIYNEPNPIPIKMALHLMGLIESPECRLPLVQALDSTREKLEAELAKLKQAGLL